MRMDAVEATFTYQIQALNSNQTDSDWQLFLSKYYIRTNFDENQGYEYDIRVHK